MRIIGAADGVIIPTIMTTHIVNMRPKARTVHVRGMSGMLGISGIVMLSAMENR